MVQINFARREVNCKVVYYGPGLSGKTTNLEMIHRKAGHGVAGALTSVATDEDRTLFFDFMPLDIGQVAGMKTKICLYTVPGQVYYNSTRKLVLQGADGVVFVADSDPNRMPDNVDSINNLQENLKEYNLDLGKIPFVIQFNKRDLPGALPVSELNGKLNRWNAPSFEAVAVKGEGILQTLKHVSRMIIDRLNEDYGPGRIGAAAPAAAPAPPAPAPSAPPRPAVGAPVKARVEAPRPPPPPPPVPRPIPARPAAPAAPPRPVARPTPARTAPRAKESSAKKVALLVTLLITAGIAAAVSYFMFLK
ncbi:MAG: GTPase [Planctomycetes bacterium]|nr:GTPase [Planctomycetota bacterium]